MTKWLMHVCEMRIEQVRILLLLLLNHRHAQNFFCGFRRKIAWVKKRRRLGHVVVVVGLVVVAKERAKQHLVIVMDDNVTFRVER